MDYGMDYQGGGGGFGGGGFGGGGFGGASQSQHSQTQNSGGRARRSYDEQTCLPVTVRMVLSSRDSDATGEGGPGSGLVLEDGRKLSHVRIVGAVRSREQFTTNLVYEIEDGTGLISVKQWNDESNLCTAIQEMRRTVGLDTQYVKIVGSVKEYDGHKQIIAETVRPLTTGNEVAHHFLEVVYSAEKYKRSTTYVGPSGAAAVSGHPAFGAGIGFGGPSAAAAGPVGVGVPLQPMGAGGGADGNSPDALKDSIIQYFQSVGHGGGEDGIHIKELFDHCPQYNQNVIRAMMDDMTNEGILYSTTNEDRYAFAM